MGPTGATWRFVALGDNRSNPDLWAQVMSAAAKETPCFALGTPAT